MRTLLARAMVCRGMSTHLLAAFLLHDAELRAGSLAGGSATEPLCVRDAPRWSSMAAPSSSMRREVCAGALSLVCVCDVHVLAADIGSLRCALACREICAWGSGGRSATDPADDGMSLVVLAAREGRLIGIPPCAAFA